MAEEVSTGGVMRFRYSKEEKSKINEELKKDIQDAYGRYYGRKARELMNKRILWIVIGLIILILIGLTFWKLVF